MSPILIAAALAAAPAYADPVDATAPPTALSPVVVTADPARLAPLAPNTAAHVDAQALADTVNVVTPEDALRNLPDILVRQRHFGDTQAPITTRTSGVGASARSLIYADGILLSALIGNNNNNASPRWGLVEADAIQNVDVLYGPFSAAYPGNAIGAVVNITTRTPQTLEGQIEIQGAGQFFHKYGDDKTLGTGRIDASVGDRIGRFVFRAGYNHLESDAQPLTYATVARPAAPSTAGAVTTGGFLDANRLGAPIEVLGSTGIEHQAQDNLNLKLGYDFTPTLTGTYTAALFRNDDRATVNSYLRNAAGQPVYAAPTNGALNIGGYAYNVAASSFSGGVYRFEEDQLAQAVTLASHTGGVFDWEVVATTLDYLKSRQRIPSTALPAAFSGGAGSTTSLDGTGWFTFDAKGVLRPQGTASAHVISFGAHADGFKLNNPRYALTDWRNGSAGATQSFGRGRTETQALWVQDVWRFAPGLTATIGGRYEHWDAYDGLNVSATPALNKTQPTEGAWRFSPKGVLAFTPWAGWTFKGSLGVAYRFPTVTELYQSVTVGQILAVPNPNLRPENALSGELAAERRWSNGRVQLSLFGERISDALISQTGQPDPRFTTLASFVQNIDLVRTRGVELVGQQDDALIRGLSLSGWVTYVDARTVADTAYPAAVGKNLPQLPRLRAGAVATYHPDARWAITLSARYSDRSYGTIDNTDTYANTYQGFGAWFVVDAHVRYQFTPHLSGDVGVDNLGDRSYFLFHPFPQRTVIAGLKYVY